MEDGRKERLNNDMIIFKVAGVILDVLKRMHIQIDRKLETRMRKIHSENGVYTQHGQR